MYALCYYSTWNYRVYELMHLHLYTVHVHHTKWWEYCIIALSWYVRMMIIINCRGCLRSWLEQDTVCPTCRRSLSQDLANGQGQGAEPAEGGRGQARRRNPRNWLLHFNGASIASWLPTFSLELHQEDTLINDTAALHRGVSSCNNKKGSEAKWANPKLNVGNCLKSSKMD